MRWFKHKCTSIKDTVIFEAIEQFGGDGYLVYFGTLEMMGDEFDIYQPGIVRLSLKKMTSFFQLSRQKTVRILRFFNQKAEEKPKENVSFLVQFEKDHVVINCRKFAELCDNHTQLLLRNSTKTERSKNEVTSFPYIPPEAEVEEEKDLKTAVVIADSNTRGSDNTPSTEETKDEGQPFLTNPKGFEKLEPLITDLLPHFPGVRAFVDKYRSNGHVNALEHTLKHLLSFITKYNEKPKSPWAYCEKIMKTENGNYNEIDAIARHNALKSADRKGTTEGLKKAGDALKGVME